MQLTIPKILFIYWMTFFCFEGFGQSVQGFPVVQNYSPQTYGAHRQNWQIAQAPNGIMYFANGKGLLSFNGEEWELTLMPNRGHVRSLDVDENGTVYVGANNDFGKLVDAPSSGERIFQSFLPLIDSIDHNFGRIRKDYLYSTKASIFRLTKGCFVYKMKPSKHGNFKYDISNFLCTNQLVCN